jgi:hypothetical protein
MDGQKKRSSQIERPREGPKIRGVQRDIFKEISQKKHEMLTMSLLIAEGGGGGGYTLPPPFTRATTAYIHTHSLHKVTPTHPISILTLVTIL